MVFIKGQKAWNKGKKRPLFSNEWRDKMRISHLGKSSGMLGKHHTKKTKAKLSKWRPNIEQLEKMTHREEAHPMWKGDKVGKAALHHWVKRKLGFPNKCEHCGLISESHWKIQWANKSGKYKRDVADWLRLCGVCHWKYDRKSRLNKLKKGIV